MITGPPTSPSNHLANRMKTFTKNINAQVIQEKCKLFKENKTWQFVKWLKEPNVVVWAAIES